MPYIPILQGGGIRHGFLPNLVFAVAQCIAGWPQHRDGRMYMTPAQLSMLLEGMEWRRPKRSERPGFMA